MNGTTAYPPPKQTLPIIQTMTGAFSADNPDGYDFDYREIGLALGNTARFNGQGRFYSVAEHSVILSKVIPSPFALAALLHDAAEAYFGDIPTPWKKLFCLPIVPVMAKTTAAIMARHGVEWTMAVQNVVHWYNYRLMNTERQLYYGDFMEWEALDGFDPFPDIPLEYWGPEESGRRFIERYDDLRKAKDKWEAKETLGIT